VTNRSRGHHVSHVSLHARQIAVQRAVGLLAIAKAIALGFARGYGARVRVGGRPRRDSQKVLVNPDYREERAMTRRAVASDRAPDALGPYSQAIVAGGFVFCSGMAGIDPATGAIPEGIEAQTERALLNLAAVLDAAGASMDDLVKTTIFYADVEDFSRLNEVYARHMPDPPPARSAPAHVRLPRGLLVSIEAIAVLRGVSP
jgi:2-iminobutanoate/2-iminopropanoate deaminase